MTTLLRSRHVTLKLSRAKEHQTTLNQAITEFLSTQPYSVAVRRDASSRKPIYYVREVRAVPDGISVIAGDVLQNLMGALDHLAYQLVCVDTADNPPNPRWTYFPIADSRVEYDNKKAGKLLGASAPTMGALDGLSPYFGGNDSLWRLYRLNTIEKHRLLLTVGSQAAGIHLGELLSMNLPAGFSPEAVAQMKAMTLFLNPADKGFPLAPGFELYTGAIDGPENPTLKFRFQLALNEPGIAEGLPLMETIGELVSAVETSVAILKPLIE